jgi:hypothetical protein
MKIQTLALTALATTLISTSTQAASEPRSASVQAILGAVRYDNFEIPDGTGNSKPIDISTMPQFGGAWSTAPKGDKLQFGLECSLLFGFNYESDTYYPTAVTRVSVDYNIWTFDLAGGLYANLFLGKAEKIRIYVAGGPMMMPTLFNSYTYQDGPINDSYYRNSESAFSYGLYGRTGIEFRVHEYGMLGLGVRGTWLDSDLSNVDTLVGVSAFVTYTASL